MYAHIDTDKCVNEHIQVLHGAILHEVEHTTNSCHTTNYIYSVSYTRKLPCRSNGSSVWCSLTPTSLTVYELSLKPSLS